jgi:hypothetical protein
MSRFVSSDVCIVCARPITHIESCIYLPVLLDSTHRHNTVIMQGEGMCSLNHQQLCTVYEQCIICNWLPVENTLCCLQTPLHTVYVEKVTAICYKCNGPIVHIGMRCGKLANILWHYTDGIPHRHDRQYNYALVRCANGHTDTHQIYSTCHCGWTQERRR